MKVCNLCGWRGEEFAPRFRTEGRLVVCPDCQSLDRQRYMWLVMEQSGVLDGRPAVLDVGPSPAITSRVAPRSRYASIDVQAFTPAVIPMNLTRLEFPSDYFDVVLCSHVLEHIKDDGAALREMYRTLRPGGRLFLQVPHKTNLAADTEEWEPPDRHGHWRMYGAQDLQRRLEAIGFDVTSDNVREAHLELELDRMQLFTCRKPASDDAPEWDYALLDWMAERRAADAPDPKAFVHKPIST
jgi:SAM-dependent methyltransferase